MEKLTSDWRGLHQEGGKEVTKKEKSKEMQNPIYETTWPKIL